MIKKIWKSALLLSLVSLSAMANVSLRNGNFFMGYIDINYPGGYEPKIERVYNSKSPYNGLFGWGWGNEYEVYMTVSIDGSVVVNEYGGGAQNRFNPPSFNSRDLDEAVAKLATAAQKAGLFGTSDQLAQYKKKLKGDAEFRNNEWNKFRAQGKVEPRKLAVGTKLISNRFAYQWITVTNTGYTRQSDTGKTELFDPNGRLIKVTDRNGNSIQLSYNRDGRIEKVTDNFNRKMFFSYTRRGKIEKIVGENSKTAEFKYNDLDELVYAKDVDGNVYTYRYSSDKRHNLTEIGYSDKTTLKVVYYGRDKLENVKSVRDRDNTTTEYTYDRVNGDKSTLKVGVVVKDQENKPITTSSYEYFFKTKANGEEWTQRMISTLDGEKTDTTYSEGNGLPIRILRGTDETTFAYDDKGRVLKKTTPNEVTELSYDSKVGKVTRVAKYPKGNKKQIDWSNFQYDAKGNLVFAQNSKKQGVRLVYDNSGRIKTMLDQNKRRIDFKYNENSKPIEITDPQLGSIKVEYNNSGEVKKVDSAGGRKIALQVTSAFQNLLEIIRPAGVTLSF